MKLKRTQRCKWTIQFVKWLEIAQASWVPLPLTSCFLSHGVITISNLVFITTSDLPKFTCSSGLSQGSAGRSNSRGFYRDWANCSGWAVIVPPGQVQRPKGHSGSKQKPVHRPPYSQLTWSNKQQLWEREVGCVKGHRVKGWAGCLLRIEPVLLLRERFHLRGRCVYPEG